MYPFKITYKINVLKFKKKIHGDYILKCQQVKVIAGKKKTS